MDTLGVQSLAHSFRASAVMLAALASALATATYADPYSLSKPAPLSESDLRVIAGFLDITFQRFDIDIKEDFCIRISVAVTPERTADPGPHWEHCALAGPHRLVVALRAIDDSSVVVRSALHDLNGMGGMAGSGPIQVPSQVWSAARTVGPDGEPPVLSEGERTVIAGYEYGRRGEHRVSIRVDAELSPNPARAISSGVVSSLSGGARR